MLLRLLVLTICCGGAAPALAGQAPAPTPALDLSRLPVNVGRIGRQIRQADVREERNGLTLRYTLSVFGETPRLRLITPLDNLLTGDVPRSAPTHADMLRMMTPPEFRGGAAIFATIPRRK